MKNQHNKINQRYQWAIVLEVKKTIVRIVLKQHELMFSPCMNIICAFCVDNNNNINNPSAQQRGRKGELWATAKEKKNHRVAIGFLNMSQNLFTFNLKDLLL